MKIANRNTTGIIFNIQKFSVNDGPGIRTTVFLKGCPLRCKWCANPESQLVQTQILWDQKKCINCHHCIETCPKNAIKISEKSIKINHSQCSGCKKCVCECPKNALSAQGEQKSVEEVLKIVLQDQVFYEESGGGLTLSGGELLLQPDFSRELLLAAKEEGLHTCCETTGFATQETFDYVMEQVDYILFDMKHWSSGKHIEGTNVSNELPLLNMKHAIENGKTVLPRIPVIPGFNDSLEDAKEFSKTLLNLGINKCQLLPFHQFGENKYHLLNQKYDYENVPSYHPEDLKEYLNVFIENNINAFI